MTLTDSDVEARTRYAGTLTAAALRLAEAAREVRDTGIAELLRQGKRPAEVSRIAGLASSQMARHKPGTRRPGKPRVADEAQQAQEAEKLLREVIDTGGG